MNKLLLSVIVISVLGCQNALFAPKKVVKKASQPQPIDLSEYAVATDTDTAVNNTDDNTDHNPDISHKYQYKVRGKQYKVFKSGANFQQTGDASWYGPGFHGRKTASGEIYNMYAMTAAHKTLPLGTRVQVTNLSNGKKIIVKINDRGPFHSARIIDLSKKAAQQLDIIKSGFAKVHIKTID